MQSITHEINLNTLTAALHPTMELAIKLGELALQLRHAGLQNEIKSDDSPVTNADKEISAILEEELYKIIPAPTLSEENTSRIDEISKHKNWWLIDPIDGTSSYISGFPGFAVSIAFVENNQVVLGVICAPALDSLYYAVKGQGAFKRIISTGATSQIFADKFDQSDFAFASYFNPRPGEEASLQDFLKINNLDPKVVIKSSACLKYCGVAEGTYDLAGGWKPLAIWDIGAADIIVKESGGSFQDFSTGNEIFYSPNELRVEAPMAIGRNTNVKRV